MRHDRRVAVAPREVNRGERLRQGPDLVDLDEDRVGDAQVDAALQTLDVRDEQVVADELERLADAVGQRLPTAPVLLVHAVLDRHDRVLAGKVRPVVRELLGGQLATLVLEVVDVAGADLARGRVERDEHVLARAIARRLDAAHEHLQRLLVGAEVGREPALVSDGGAQAAVVQRALQRVEHLGAHPQALRERRRARRDDHELLEVDLVVGVGPAVEDVHHRDRQHMRRLAAEVAPQRQPLLRGGRVGGCQRHAEDRVGAQPRLVRRCVELHQRAVQALLVGRVAAAHRLGDLTVDVGHGVQHALAEVGALVAVAQLGRLELAGRRAGRHRRASRDAGAQCELDLDRRVAPRVQDLARMDLLDLAHSFNLACA